MTRRLKKWLLGGLVFFIGVVGYVLYVNASSIGVENSRDKRLDMYELAKSSITNDMRLYLTINDESSYQQAVETVNFTPDLKNTLLGDRYNAVIGGYSGVQFLDVQYSLMDDNGYNRYNLTVKLDKDGSSKVVTFIVFAKGKQINDILVY